MVALGAQLASAQDKAPCERYREFTALYLKGIIEQAQKIIDSEAAKGVPVEKVLQRFEAFSKEKDDPATIIGGALAVKKPELAVYFCTENLNLVFKSPAPRMPLGCAVAVAETLPPGGALQGPAEPLLRRIARAKYVRAWEHVEKLAETETERRRVALLFSAFLRCYGE